jgi:hypothetical protein
MKRNLKVLQMLLCATLVLCFATSAFPQENTQPRLKARFEVFPLKDMDIDTVREQMKTPGATIPLWSSSTVYKTIKYTFEMVGVNPFKKETVQSVSVPVIVIPVQVVIGGVTFDPTAADFCAPPGFTSDSAVKLTENSPVFMNNHYILGGKDIGTVQYIDFEQRSQFYHEVTKLNGNPNLHVIFNETTLPVFVATIPPASSSLEGPGCLGSDFLGGIDINFWDGYVKGTIIPALKTMGVNPTVIPVLLVHNVVWYAGNPANCCILGYHGAYSNGGTFQTYSNADFDDTHQFDGGGIIIEDVHVLTHELGELINDPTGGNPTPLWGHIGQVGGCQGNLEVGDALTGTAVQVLMPNGFTYNPQELVYYDWFYRKGSLTKPNKAPDSVNGWESTNDTLKVVQGPCH